MGPFTLPSHARREAEFPRGDDLLTRAVKGGLEYYTSLWSLSDQRFFPRAAVMINLWQRLAAALVIFAY